MNEKPLLKKIKKMAILFFAVTSFFLPATTLAGSWNGWIYQNPYPTSNTLLGVKFITPEKGWIAGEKGTILYTEDGGDTWEAQESGTEQDIKSITFVNEKVGWAVGNGGVIIHTEDVGKTWVSQGEIKKASLNKVIFLNEKEGWAVGTDWTESGGGLVLHTTDGGKKWERLDIGIKRAIASIRFINPQTGWILAGDEVYRTIDGGEKWEKSKFPINKFPKGGTVGSSVIINMIGEEIPPDWGQGNIFFTDEKNGWAVVGFWFIFHTEDGGKSWINQLDTGYMSYGLSHITFIDSQRGCATGSSIFCTENGGKTWIEKLGINPGGGNMTFKEASFAGNSTGWAVGYDETQAANGQIIQTKDGGKSWQMVSREDECGRNTFFVDKKTGWLYNYGAARICRTDDGGFTWKKQDVGIKVLDIFFKDNLKGWAVGNHLEGKNPDYPDEMYGVIRHTTDGGKTWTTQFKELMGRKKTDDGLFSVFFINNDIGWADGDKGVILHTKNGGKHWEHQQNSDSKLSLRGIQFVDSKVGWIAGTRVSDGWTGVILYTEDGGKHWETQVRKENLSIDEIFFIDKESGWITGRDEGEVDWVFHTKDSGKTWIEKTFRNISYAQSYPAFIDRERGVIVTDKGLILVTFDGGSTWIKRRTLIRKYPWHFSEIFDDKNKSK